MGGSRGFAEPFDLNQASASRMGLNVVVPAGWVLTDLRHPERTKNNYVPTQIMAHPAFPPHLTFPSTSVIITPA